MLTLRSPAVPQEIAIALQTVERAYRDFPERESASVSACALRWMHSATAGGSAAGRALEHGQRALRNGGAYAAVRVSSWTVSAV